ncbi:type I secretion protein, partial [Aphanothece hegewaldii CCALA 016]
KVVDDTIVLSASGFAGGLAIGTLAANQFIIGSAATTAAHRVIYNSTTGGLFFDVDGVGATAATQFAILDPALLPTNADFLVIA